MELKRGLNIFKQRGLALYALLCILAILSTLLPFPLWFVINLVISWIVIRLRMWITAPLLFGLLSIAALLKAVNTTSILVEIARPVPSVTNYDQYFVENFPASLTLGWDYDLLYLHIRARVREAHAPWNSVDPFTGEFFKEEVGATYSLGPDQIDDRGQVIYDVTNGIFSRGDIIRSSLPIPSDN